MRWHPGGMSASTICQQRVRVKLPQPRRCKREGPTQNSASLNPLLFVMRTSVQVRSPLMFQNRAMRAIAAVRMQARMPTMPMALLNSRYGETPSGQRIENARRARLFSVDGSRPGIGTTPAGSKSDTPTLVEELRDSETMESWERWSAPAKLNPDANRDCRGDGAPIVADKGCARRMVSSWHPAKPRRPRQRTAPTGKGTPWISFPLPMQVSPGVAKHIAAQPSGLNTGGSAT